MEQNRRELENERDEERAREAERRKMVDKIWEKEKVYRANSFVSNDSSICYSLNGKCICGHGCGQEKPKHFCHTPCCDGMITCCGKVNCSNQGR